MYNINNFNTTANVFISKDRKDIYAAMGLCYAKGYS